MNLCLVVLLFAATMATAASAKNMRKNTEEEEENMSQNQALVQSKNGERKIEDVPQKQKRKVAIESVVAIAELSLNLLTTVLDALGSIYRKLAIGIGNETGYKWEAINVYFYSGTSDGVLGRYIPDQKASVYAARKTSGVARGVVGALCYYIPSHHRSLCVLFSVPYNYHFYSNWWHAKVYYGKKAASYGVYYSLYYDDPFGGDNAWHTNKAIGHGYSIKEGYMSSSGNPRLEMIIKK